MRPQSEADIAEEQQHFAKVVATFEQYASYSLAANNRRRKDLFSLSLEDQKLLDELGWKQRLVDVDNAILENAKFVRAIIAEPEIFSDADLFQDGDEDDYGEQGATEGSNHIHSHLHSGGPHHGFSHLHPGSSVNNTAQDRPSSKKKRYRPTDFDMDKLRSTLKQFVRDWSDEGKSERDVCYEPMKDALLRHFANVPEAERSKLRVLVPGAGLGRLAYDIARLGFSCQGNEFSHYMLLASFFILNRTEQVHQHTIYPHVHSFSNIPNREALLRPVSIPDAFPSAIPRGVNFSLVAGDFEEVYGNDDHEEDEPQAGKWNAVMTCFFIDTAKNVINYLRIIHRILAPGGVWINLGPLLWHWENNTTNDPSIELDLEEVKALCRKLGFRLENERTLETTYTNNSQSMLGYVYKTAFWTATKVEEEARQ
ncbi:N2227-domain-containing protein [Fomitiporia mediterranea MF3/22]|uniref:N2227-domain-containing protein n=1 Tax=Fomitiporia mediterranea (strain MF3/22) TaxID=694068 RepID=UPI0004407F97|nr:N2227-domain-containing protein [Fomitiporia mediterranea MF3/22]EJD01859.1 N2227-domain-containing protein [Fomitiporia mediterranea MF3/22]